MENNSSWKIPQEDVNRIEKLPIEDQANCWRNLYEMAMQTIQNMMISDIGTIVTREKDVYVGTWQDKLVVTK